MSRGDFVPKRTDRTAAEDRTDAELLESEDVRGERHVAWRESVSLAVTVQKGNLLFTEPADQDCVARLAERCIDLVTLRIGDTRRMNRLYLILDFSLP